MLNVAGARSLAVIEMARAGRFADISELFAPPLRPLVSAESLQAAWGAELGRRGPVREVGAPISEAAQHGVTLVKILITCERGDFTLLVSVTSAGALTGLQIAPASAAQPAVPWEPPGYAQPGQFGEQELTVGTGPLAVQGTVSLPRQPTGSGIVLLAGSGPLDRDETIGRNKPFKDLAWGLASRGIAVLRFDKVTRAHPREVTANPAFTATDEYLPHATAAIHLLQQRAGIDPTRVFLLGHSLGGTIAPRVAASEPSVAGLIILAGGTQPLHWATVRQLRYLAGLDPSAAGASASVIEAITQQAGLVDSPALSPSTPSSDLPFSIPAPYWLDLRGYQPAAAAAALGKPILILQGGRDYQVTTADDLPGWQAGLAHCTDVTTHLYDADNHLFFPGAGPSTPAGYEPAQHVDPAVVTDIAHWVTALRPSSAAGTPSLSGPPAGRDRPAGNAHGSGATPERP